MHSTHGIGTLQALKIFFWEFWHGSRRRLPAIFVGMLLLSVLFYESFATIGPATIDVELRLFLILLLNLLLAYVTGVCLPQAQPGQESSYATRAFEPRLYTLPIRTSVLTGTKMAVSMAAATLLYLATALLILPLTGHAWPLLGPAAFFATATAWALAVTWTLMGTLLQLPVGATVALTLLFWLGRRFGAGLDGIPTHPWQVTAADLATLALASAAAFGFAVVGVSRDRRGDTWGWTWNDLKNLSLGRSLDRLFFRRKAGGFASPLAAQFWLEWRLRGWMLPAMVGVTLLSTAGFLALIGRGTAPILQTQVLLLGATLILGPPGAGTLMGKMRLFSHESGLGTFRASRPLSDGQLAGVLLKVGLASLLSAWLTALACFGAVLFALRQWGEARLVDELWHSLSAALEPFDLTTRVALLFLLLAVGWMNMGLVTAIFLTGRHWIAWLLVEIPYGLAVVYLILNAFQPAGWVEILEWIAQAAPWIFGAVALAVPPLAYGTARRLRLVHSAAPWIALGVWLLAVALLGIHQREWIAQALSSGLALERAVLVLGLGLLALLTAPPALAPLAVAWNRHR